MDAYAGAILSTPFLFGIFFALTFIEFHKQWRQKMQDSLMINNMYAAYTATSKGTDKNISELSKMLRDRNVSADKSEKSIQNMEMDKLMLSAEAREMLKETFV
jgi:hypothetical protein